MKYYSLDSATLDAVGHVSFRAETTAVGSPNGAGVFSQLDDGSTLAIALRGGVVAGAGDATLTYYDFGAPRRTSSGRVAFGTSMRRGTSTTNISAVVTGPLTAPSLALREGSGVAGAATPPVDTISTTVFNDADTIVYRARDLSTGRFGLYVKAAGATPVRVARMGDAISPPLPGTDVGALTYLNIENFTFGLVLNDVGHLAYGASVVDATGTTSTALFVGPATAPRAVAVVGTRPAGLPANVTTAGVQYYSSLSRDGRVAYAGTVDGPDVDTTNNSVVCVGAVDAAGPSDFTCIARGGDLAPGTTAETRFQTFNAPSINDSGTVAVRALLNGPGVTLQNLTSVYVGQPGALRLVIRGNDVVPRAAANPATPSTVRVEYLDNPILNDLGQVACTGTFRGAPAGPYSIALYAFDPTLGTRLIARAGDLIDVGGATKTVAYPYLSGTVQLIGLAPNGTLAYKLYFTDGTSGLFTTVVPEPTLTGVGVALLTTFARRRRAKSDPR